jgi:hypothetical protein
MVTNKEEQLHRYFEHVMSPVEEQSFLITVAASDEMRIAFRSQLELMKAVRSDKDSLRSVAQVRSRTLTALGLSATAVTPFIEHELLRGAKSQEAEINQSAGILGDSSPLSGGWISRISSLIRQPIIALTGGLALGVLSTTAVMREIESNANMPTVIQTVPQSAIIPTSPLNSQINGKVTETIPQENGLNSSNHSVPVASGHLGENDRSVAQKPANLRIGASSAVSTIPEVNRSAAAKLQSHKAVITKDSAVK